MEGRESGRGEGIALAKKVFRLSAEGRTEANFLCQGDALAKKVFRLSAEGRTEAEIAKEAGIGLEEVRGILE